MAMLRKTITITNQQELWIRSVIQSGDYGNDSEYFRDLIRRDQERRSAEGKLRRMLEQADNGGMSDRTPREIWAAAEARHKSGDGSCPPAACRGSRS